MPYGQYFFIHIPRSNPNKYTGGPIIISKHSTIPKRCNRSGAKFVINLMEFLKIIYNGCTERWAGTVSRLLLNNKENIHEDWTKSFIL